MIAKKTILSLAIICLLLNLANAFRIKKLASAAPNSIATRRPKPIQTIRVYRTIRRFVIYCWGKNQFKNFQKQFSQHAIKYGSYYILLYNLVYMAFFIKSYCQEKQHKQQKISEMVSSYQSKMQATSSGELEEDEINRAIAFLHDNLWILQKRRYSSLQIFTTEISIIKVIYSEKQKYKILMCGVDSLGISDLCGVLTINKGRMELKLIKQYQNYLSFLTNQQWRNVIYQGQSGPDFCWQGQWYTLDEQSDPNYSGQWKLMPKFGSSSGQQLLCTQCE